MKTFLSQARNQIEKVMPSGSELHCFVGVDMEETSFSAYQFSMESGSSYKLVNILVFASKMESENIFREEIARYRNLLINNVCLLIIIYEEESKGIQNGLGEFLSNEVNIFHPNYLLLPSFGDENYKTTIDGFKYLSIGKTLEYIYTGQLVFNAPRPGYQPVNLEIMTDTCPECQKQIHIINGIVFPDSSSNAWDNDRWKYYNTLIPITSLNEDMIKQIKPYVKRLITKNPYITPIAFRNDIENEECYWITNCPCCGTFISPYFIEDNRLDLLHDMNSRLNHLLDYKTINLPVDQELLNLLMNDAEYNPHCRLAGWMKINNKR